MEKLIIISMLILPLLWYFFIFPSFSSNKYIYVFISGLLEIPSYMILGPLLKYLGRIKCFALFYCLCGILILVALGYQVSYPEGKIFINS